MDPEGANAPSHELVERKTVKNPKVFIVPRTRPSIWNLVRHGGWPGFDSDFAKTCASSKYMKYETGLLASRTSDLCFEDVEALRKAFSKSRAWCPRDKSMMSAQGTAGYKMVDVPTDYLYSSRFLVKLLVC